MTKTLCSAFAIIIALLNSILVFAQPLETRPYSTRSEEGYYPCRDTFTFALLKKSAYYDLNLILPSWLPIVDKNYVAVIEGKIASNLTNGSNGPIVSHEDLPFYHYTHDFNFDLIPDTGSALRCDNYLCHLIYQKEGGFDTVPQTTIHCEWETGLGMSNPVNPLRGYNDEGKSGGFYSAGHEREDVIWNWPSFGDWAHVEGAYVWDRGHPPAHAEIHPARLTAFKRNLPEQINIGDSSVKFATRIDIFASGDGGALYNNRYNAPSFVNRVNMSSKDYEMKIRTDLPRPSPNAQLRYKLVRQKGDNFSQYELIETNDSGFVHILIPWKTKDANDLEIYARTVYLYWDEGRGANSDMPIDVYKVKLTNLKFRHLGDKLSKAEVRLFANVGNNWIFLNDFHPRKGKILTKGLGKTRKHKWTLNNEFIVSVPRGKSFRVYMSGWEVDGVDQLAGDLLDPGLPCNRKTKRLIQDRSFSFRNMILRGCMDDEYGEISKLHNYENLGRKDFFINSPKEGINEDPCPGSRYPLSDRYFLSYTIEKLN